MHITTTVSCNKVCYKSFKGGLFCGNILSLILMPSFLGPTKREISENLGDCQRFPMVQFVREPPCVVDMCSIDEVHFRFRFVVVVVLTSFSHSLLELSL